MTGSFLFVAVGPDGRGVEVNPVAPESAAERALFEQGEQDKTRRSKERELSLDRRRPTDEESDVLHAMLSGGRGGSHRTRIGLGHEAAASSSAWTSQLQPEQPPSSGFDSGSLSTAHHPAAELRSTRLSNTVLMQPQQRNTAGRVFGGYLMR